MAPLSKMLSHSLDAHFPLLHRVLNTIVCSRSVGRGLRAEVYVMVECSYFAYTSRLTVCP